MRSRTIFILTVLSAALVSGLFAYRAAQAAPAEVDFKKTKPPGAYGTVLMDKSTRDSGAAKPVLFPHWAHRAKYSCKACHTDLGFAMKAAATDIRQADLEAGKYCGKCHDGTASFGLSECNRCHSYGADAKGNQRIEDAARDLPKDDFGNKVNWAEAVRKGKIKPAAGADGKGEMTVLDMDVVIPVTKFPTHPPDVLFPHKAHTEQLECASCHPSIFKQEKGGNPDMNMMRIIAGKYCGECHGKVAFPLDDCFKCHSQPAPAPKKEEPKADAKGAAAR